MEHTLVSTTFTVEGYRVVRQLGLVRGVLVRSRNVLLTVAAVQQTLAAGRIAGWQGMAEQSRQDAYDELVRHSEALGANGVIGFRYDATEIAGGVQEVIACGTAGIFERA